MDKFNILIEHDQIIEKIKELAKKLNQHYANTNEEIIVVSVLNGALVFTGHLLTKLNFPLFLITIKVSSYGKNLFSNKEPKISLGCDPDFYFTNKKILILEDLIDTGLNLSTVIKYFSEKNAKDIKICCLIDKKIPDHSKRNVQANWIGFSIEDKWICGFGIDSSEQFRNKPDILVKIDE